MTFLFNIYSINNIVLVSGLRVIKLQRTGMAYSSLQAKNLVYTCDIPNGKT